jgi:hypothetical protein
MPEAQLHTFSVFLIVGCVFLFHANVFCSVCPIIKWAGVGSFSKPTRELGFVAVTTPSLL